ncbi:MAG: hypothetical protein HYU60_04005 [Magnetospirillum sp.]|nr:hypothetical protein [Magnetospirillum sp.]
MQGYTEAVLAVRQFLDWQEEWKLAKAVRYLLRRGGWPAHSCRPDHLHRIREDRALSAYFASVREADVWDEEISRVRRRQMECRRARKWGGDRSDAGGGELSATAVMDLLPTWRGWGALLLAAERHADPSLLA